MNCCLPKKQNLEENEEYENSNSFQYPNNLKFYDLKFFIGSGATSQVFKYEDPVQKKTYAVKLILFEVPDHLINKEKSVLNHLMSLRPPHKGIINYYGYRQYIIDKVFRHVFFFEYGSGTLKNFIDRKDFQGFFFDSLIDFFYQTYTTLLYLEIKGLAHRDLKPGNILYNEDKKKNKVLWKFADFGMSKLAHFNAYSNTCVGTPEYMPPEILSAIYQFQESTKYQAYRVDLYCLGEVIIRMCLKKHIDKNNKFQKSHHDKNVNQLMEQIKAKYTEEIKEKYLQIIQEQQDINPQQQLEKSAKNSPKETNIQNYGNNQNSLNKQTLKDLSMNNFFDDPNQNKTTNELVIQCQYKKNLSQLNSLIEILKKMLTFDYEQNVTALKIYEFVHQSEIFDQSKLDNKLLNYIIKGKISTKIAQTPEIKVILNRLSNLKDNPKIEKKLLIVNQKYPELVNIRNLNFPMKLGNSVASTKMLSNAGESIIQNDGNGMKSQQLNIQRKDSSNSQTFVSQNNLSPTFNNKNQQQQQKNMKQWIAGQIQEQKILNKEESIKLIQNNPNYIEEFEDEEQLDSFCNKSNRQSSKKESSESNKILKSKINRIGITNEMIENPKKSFQKVSFSNNNTSTNILNNIINNQSQQSFTNSMVKNVNKSSINNSNSNELNSSAIENNQIQLKIQKNDVNNNFQNLTDPMLQKIKTVQIKE